jgi:cell division protein FtsI/penicillin-binding protein 2
MASSITVKLGPLPQEVASQPAQALDKTSLAMLIGSRPIPEEQPGLFSIQGPQGQNLYVATTLDQGLQTQVAKWVSQSRAHKAALVALDPRNGRVLAMAGLDGENREANAALDGDFPAASLFKIVTAAAALEKAEMRADSTVAYDGAKHTLFKSNVEKEPDKGRHQATLRESFAESINSVFGKLGAYTVGPDGLTQYADRFGFNQPIAFEMPVGESRFEVDDFDTFRLAELASGFNRLTRVSPIHGAMLAAAAINSGVIFEPTFVSEVFDRQNNILYRSQPRNLGQSVNPKTAEALKELMLAAVTEGTGRKKFSDALSHPILSKLALGGKSGTINDDQGYRVDWFVAFSAIKERGRESYPLALAAVVVHNGQTRMGSQELIRRAILDYYRPKLKDS